MVNVSKNKEVIRLSRATIAPITYVPYICLYINGKPFIRYDGPHDEGEIRRFVLEVASKLQNKDKFASGSGSAASVNHPAVKDTGKGIPEYTIGKPVCENDVCYLDFEEAYH
jgi:thioredoxin-like negative regulator of GroEL